MCLLHKTEQNSSDITAVQVIACETKVQRRKTKLKLIPNTTIYFVQMQNI